MSLSSLADGKTPNDLIPESEDLPDVLLLNWFFPKLFHKTDPLRGQEPLITVLATLIIYFFIFVSSVLQTKNEELFITF